MLRNHTGMMITLPEKHYDESTRVTDRPILDSAASENSRRRADFILVYICL